MLFYGACRKNGMVFFEAEVFVLQALKEVLTFCKFTVIVAIKIGK